MSSNTMGPGVRRFRDLRAQGERVDVAAITREYPGEALALADETRHAIVRDSSLARERAWLSRIEVRRAAGEDASLGATIRGERTERGLTVAALARAVRDHGVDLSAAELRRIEANEVDTNAPPEIWPAVIAKLHFDGYTIVAEIGVALSDQGVPEPEIEAYLERVRAELGLPTATPAAEPVASPSSRDDEENEATAHRESLTSPLTDLFGEGTAWSGPGEDAATAWSTGGFDLLWHRGGTDSVLRRAWEARKGLGARPVILLSAAEDDARVRVCGPQHPRPIRELPTKRVLALLERASSLHFNEAASVLAREFIRIEESALPGLRVKELLTPHFVRERLTASQEQLERAIEGVSATAPTQWNPLFRGLGYRIEQLPERGHVLRDAAGSPVAVLHPLADADSFGRLTLDGTLPEGLLLAACDQHGAPWGVLASNGRYRLFQRRPEFGAAGGQYIEIDADELEPESRFSLGLLSPQSLREDGWLVAWAREARDFGEQLRVGLEERLVREVLPRIARGLGEHLESQGVDPGEPEQLRRISEAALTLVFRFMFLLHVEARGYLPIESAAYRGQSATQLADHTRAAGGGSPSSTSTQYWNRLRTLVAMMRSGDDDAGVPAYNGQLFAADGFPGSDLLEEAAITNAHLAPALAAIAYETDKADEPGLDYAGLQIGHLGAIYEALLSLRLTRAPEDLAYDAKGDFYRPAVAGEEPEVTRRDLYYQSEAGGRKAGGVFYTRHEFVRHLLNHSLEPALDAHLERVREELGRNPAEAARLLFDFSVLDPAMGSAHFLTAALDVMADRFGRFLAEVSGIPGVKEQLDELRREDLPGVRQPEDGDLLRRLILKRCIYGVDVSPMAVEVGNVTLWLASFVPGLALSWLDANLKCGDALIGVVDPSIVGEGRQRRPRRTREAIQRGIVATAPRTTATLLAGTPVRAAMQRATEMQQELATIPDRTPEEVAQSREMAATLHETTSGLRSAFDLWTAEPLGLSGARRVLETDSAAIIEHRGALSPEAATAVAEASRMAAEHRFFHWPLEFPSIFHRDRHGFDVVAGNPPWDEVTVEELAFYALRDPGLRSVSLDRDRRKRIAELDALHPDWRKEFEALKQRLATVRRFFSADGGYQLQGAGDTDLYQLFCERYTHLVRSDGRLGVVLPRSAFMTKGAERFRRWLFEQTTVSKVDYLLNSGRWAFSMEPRYTIALLAMQRRQPAGDSAFRATGPSASLTEFASAAQSEGVSIPVAPLGGAGMVPLLPEQRHVDLLAKLRSGVEFAALQSPEIDTIRRGASAASHVAPHRELDATQQKHLFRHPPGGTRLPVWKGESFDQYDPHGVGVAGYCDWDEVVDYLQGRRSRSPVFKSMFPAGTREDPATHPVQHSRIAFHDVTRATDSRTIKACLVPPRTPLTNKAPYLLFQGWSALAQATVLGVMNSLSFDWLARRYVELNVNFFILDMLCFPRWEQTDWQRIGSLAARLSSVDERFFAFASEVDVEHGDLAEDERTAMRAEIDALVARGYGLTAEDLTFLFTDFTENAVSPDYRARVLRKFEDLS